MSQPTQPDRATILVIGASGFVGRHVVKTLLKLLAVLIGRAGRTVARPGA